MYFFNFDMKKVLLVIVLVMVPAFLITLDRSKTEKNFLFRSFILINSQVQFIYYSMSSSISHTTNIYLNLVNTNKRNRALSLENKQLKSLLTRMQELQSENERLNSILDFKKASQIQLITSKVIGRDPISKYQLITINRGSAHSVKKNMIVINEKGVIGYIFRVLSHFSQVILLTDPHSSIPAVIQRSRVHGIVEGTDRDTCKLKYLKRKDDVKVGDVVVTSGLSFLFPGGIPIGTVTIVKKQEYGLTQEVIIKPSINSAQLEEVFIVKKTPISQGQL